MSHLLVGQFPIQVTQKTVLSMRSTYSAILHDLCKNEKSVPNVGLYSN